MERKIKKRDKKIKNNKGFTLIEIIGVVIILGIVTGIGAIAVQGYIHETKVKTYESYKQGLKGASEDLLIDCINSNEENCEIPRKGADLRLGYQELVDKGYSKRLKDPEGEGYCDRSYVIASNESENGVELKYKVCLYCSKYKSTEEGCKETSYDDKVAPTCGTFKGTNTKWTRENVVISVGCKDTGGSGCRYPEFSKSVGKEGEVTKRVSIKIEDNAGNSRYCSTDAYVDKKAPTCKIEVDETPNSGGWYKNGPTARITSIEDEGSGVDTYGMGTSLVNRDYNEKTSYQVTGGIVTVFGYVKDKVGNEGYCSKEIKVDNTNPTGEIQMGYEVYPRENTTSETLRMTVSNIARYEEVKGVIINFKIGARGRIRATVGDVSKEILLEREVSSTVIEFDQETTGSTLEIALNPTVGGMYNTLTANNIEKIEVLKEENETSIWTNKDVSVYVKGKDTITGVGQYSFDNGATYGLGRIKTYGSNTSGTVKIKDQAGNESIGYSFNINKIDKQAPTVNFTNPKDGEWTNQNIVFDVNANDGAGSGVGQYYYKYDNGSTCVNDYCINSTGASYNFSAERKAVATIRVCDNVGNCRDKTTNIWIDKTKPTLAYILRRNNERGAAISSDQWTNTNVFQKITIDDPEGANKSKSGTKEVQCVGACGDGTWNNWKTNSRYLGGYTHNQSDNSSYRVCDNAGNCSAGVNIIVKIDKVAPTFSFTNPKEGQWSKENIIFDVNASDGSGSGVGQYYYKYNNGSSCVNDYCINSTGASYNFSAERKATATIRVCDNVGNCRDKTTTIWIDKTKPTLEIDSLTINECEDSECKVVRKTLGPIEGNLFCLTERDGFFAPRLSVNWSDFSGMKDWSWTYQVYDQSGNKINQCKRTDGDNPCTLSVSAELTDNAGNSNTVTKNFKLDYYHDRYNNIHNPSCENSWK